MIDDGLLHEVIAPARYIGCEHNMVEKDPTSVALRVAMCYPDVYEVGTSHVGSHILYHILNSRDDTYCERAFHPWPDAATMLKQRNMVLSSLETGTHLRDFHLVGVTLQYELNYTGVLSLLDLGAINLRTADREFAEPIILGGGPCATNPEPLAPFFDAIVIGDGEQVIHEIMDLLATFRPPFVSSAARTSFLSELSQLEGVYVPSLWPTISIRGLQIPQPPNPHSPTVRRRIVEDLDAAPFPTNPVVPYRESIHDRAQIEIARGCTRGCRFCQAGSVYRPVRERSVETLRKQANQIIDATGYDQISLCSLSCTDYSDIEHLLEALHQDLSDRRVSIGLPSIRTDSFGVELAKRVQRVKRSGLTFAPEAGSQRLRDRINKNVTDADLIQAVRAALSSGWDRLKFYFMIGLPGETDEDILGIADTVEQVLDVGRDCMGKRAGRLRLNLSVALFIPKPHTPFQWSAQNTIEQFEHKRYLLLERLRRHRQVQIRCHDPKSAVLEAYLARGDRSAAEVMMSAYCAGASLDAWTEQFDYERWEAAAAEHGIDLHAVAARPIDLEQPLPWNHIDVGVTSEYLRSELAKSEAGALTEDCRTSICQSCGVQKMATSCLHGGDSRA